MSVDVLDLFAGAGGFSLGFSQAGANILGAIEKDRWASNTFAFNFPQSRVLCCDISDVSRDEICRQFRVKNRPLVVIGGPPCQGFSVCRSSELRIDDPRNDLWLQFIRVVNALQPAAVVIENVPGIANRGASSSLSVSDAILSSLEDQGYIGYCRILDAQFFGVPQSRKRCFVVACKYRIKKAFPDTCLIPAPSSWDAISDLPALGSGEGEECMPYANAPSNKIQKTLRGTQDILHNHESMRHTARLVSRFKALACGTHLANLPPELHPVLRRNKFRDGLFYAQNNRRLNPLKPAPTITANFYAGVVHPFSHRAITPREGARLQTFPDHYIFKGKRITPSKSILMAEGRTADIGMNQYNQVGNAVPPMLAKAIACNLMSQMLL